MDQQSTIKLMNCDYPPRKPHASVYLWKQHFELENITATLEYGKESAYHPWLGGSRIY